MKRLFLYSFSLFVLTSCNPNLDMIGMFYGQSPRSDERFAISMAYNDTAGYKSLSVPEDDYLVYVCTDIHVDSTANNIKKWANLMRNDPKCRVGLILGDMINAQGNFPRFMSGLAFDPATQANDVPVFATAGNHDIYFGQWIDYVKYWHTSSYWFEVNTPHARDFYICLDSSDGTTGRKQLKWLRTLLQEAATKDYRHIIVFTHTHIFKRDASQGHTSNFPMEETYELTDLFSRYGVELYLSGHDHTRELNTFKGVKYVIVDTMQDHVDSPYYLIATLSDDIGLSFEAL